MSEKVNSIIFPLLMWFFFHRARCKKILNNYRITLSYALWLSFRWRKHDPEWSHTHSGRLESRQGNFRDIYPHTIPTNNARDSVERHNYSNFHPKSLCAIISAQALSSSSSLASGNSMKIIIYPLSLSHPLILSISWLPCISRSERAKKYLQRPLFCFSKRWKLFFSFFSCTSFLVVDIKEELEKGGEGNSFHSFFFFFNVTKKIFRPIFPLLTSFSCRAEIFCYSFILGGLRHIVNFPSESSSMCKYIWWWSFMFGIHKIYA